MINILRVGHNISSTERAILGIVEEYEIFRHMTNLETIYTYEGTNDIHSLIVGNRVTGLSSF